MATISERNGRYTAQIRMRGFKSRSRTFSSRDQAIKWADDAEKTMGELSEAAPSPTEKLLTNGYEACGVYFLFKGSECVYVGQSMDVHRRARDHRKRIDFDVYSWTPVPPAQLPIVELMYISALQSRLNVLGK